jgi:hypothetical protein
MAGMSRSEVETCMRGNLTDALRRRILDYKDSADFMFDWIENKFRDELCSKYLDTSSVLEKCNGFETTANFIVAVLESLREQGVTYEPEDLLPVVPESAPSEWFSANEVAILSFDQVQTPTGNGFVSVDHGKCVSGLGQVALERHGSELIVQPDLSVLEQCYLESGVPDGTAYSLYFRDSVFRNRYWRRVLVPEETPIGAEVERHRDRLKQTGSGEAAEYWDEARGRVLFEYHLSRLEPIMERSGFLLPPRDDGCVEFREYARDRGSALEFWLWYCEGYFSFVESKLERSWGWDPGLYSSGLRTGGLGKRKNDVEHERLWKKRRCAVERVRN